MSILGGGRRETERAQRPLFAPRAESVCVVESVAVWVHPAPQVNNGLFIFEYRVNGVCAVGEGKIEYTILYLWKIGKRRSTL